MTKWPEKELGVWSNHTAFWVLGALDLGNVKSSQHAHLCLRALSQTRAPTTTTNQDPCLLAMKKKNGNRTSQMERTTLMV